MGYDRVLLYGCYVQIYSLWALSRDFEPTRPFPNLLQLLSVLPPQSAQFLPKPYANLMVDPASPILAYYPNDFEVL